MVFNSNFTSFDFTALYKMTYLESVDMMEVTGLPVLTNVVMLGLKNLSRLSIYHTDIKFDYNTFQNLKRLKYLSISKVDVAILGNEVFNGSMLEELYWTDSGIEKIDRYCFSPLGNIKIINLSGNKLAYLWPESFIGLRRLERLYLNRNRLATMNFRQLEHLPSLQYLDISMNKFPMIRLDEVTRNSPNLTTIVVDKKSVEKEQIANSNSRLRIVFV
ncbi:hypothetical protein WA026_002707 [Henosepilachna vigintioctopunctata]|uniref:Uncharacterized protein n=1 Tax=Henosepilachna vigintioctopunctata TaxID=420089 RepID=A0AAW1U160_9CUCU